MSKGSRREGESLLESGFGRRCEVFVDGIELLLERLDGHEPASRRASDSAAVMTAHAKSALTKLGDSLFPRSKERIDPARLLFVMQTYFALIVKLATCANVEWAFRGRSLFCGRWLREDYGQLEAGERALEFGAGGFPDASSWGWYLDVWDGRLEEWLGRLCRGLYGLEVVSPPFDPAEGHDLFGGFYIRLFPKEVRHALGEHYTPTWLADHVLDQLGFEDVGECRLLDPTCGSGVFLLRALRRLRKSGGADEDAVRLTERVVGMDVNSLAVLAARANYLLAVRNRLNTRTPVLPPVYLADIVLDEPSKTQFDFVVGNPPWLGWDHLSEEYRQRTKAHWQRYGLFSLSGSDARHGGGKKDLAMLVVYMGADRYLRNGGRLGMVVTQTLFQTRGAGDGFRRFRLGESGVPLRVLRVDDFVHVQPFETAANWTATIVLEKGEPTKYPVPYVRWTRRTERSAEGHSSRRLGLESMALEALPVDAARLQSPWLVRPTNLSVGIEQLTGPSDYTAHLGANTGGANGVYWLRLLGSHGSHLEVENMPGRGKQLVRLVRTLLEPDLLYPLVRWSDVRRFAAAPSAHLLLVQDPATRRGIDELTMQEHFPRSHAYLKQFEDQLRRRAAYRRYQGSAAFYSMYNVGPYTLAPHKVVWRRMDRVVRAAVLEPTEDPLLGTRPVVCQETCAMIAAGSADEAHYLAALLNSAVLSFLVQAHNVCGGKGFGSPGMLEHLRLRRFDGESADHQSLARLGRSAHEAETAGQDRRGIQSDIDAAAARLYDLAPSEAQSLARLVANPDAP